MFHDAVFIFTAFLCTFIVISDDVKTVAAMPSIIKTNAVNAKNKYTTRYDNIDIDKIIHIDRLKRYVECLMERGPCTRERQELKRLFPDTIQSECSKCSEIQRENAGKVLGYLLQIKRESFDELIGKYDPDGRFLKEHELDEEEEQEKKEQQAS